MTYCKEIFIKEENNLVTKWHKQNYSQPNIKDVRFLVKVKKINNGIFSYQNTINFVDLIFVTRWLLAFFNKLSMEMTL